MNSRPAAIDIMEVSKRYRGRVEALRGVSLQVPTGEIFGLLGPNGAGKSTLLKVLLTIIRPTTCKGVMLGQPIGHKNTLQKVGYLPEHAQFPEYLTGRQVIRYSAGLSGVCKNFCKNREAELLELVGMLDWADSKMRTYSKGMKQRIGLAQALVNDPAIVFLDEPTDGVDPQGRMEMRGVLKSLRDQGKTVFINSHLLGELEMVCDSVAMLNKGKLVKQGRLSELIAGDGQYAIEYAGDLNAAVMSELNRHSGVRIGAGILDVEADSAKLVQPVIDILRGNNVVIEQISKKKQSLEDLYIETVKNTGAGGHRS